MYKNSTTKARSGPGSPWQKFLLTMKLICVLLMLTFLQVSASSYAQKITLKANKMPLLTFFLQVQKQTGYDFLYNTNDLEATLPVTLDVTAMPVREALELCFSGQPLDFDIDKTSILVKRKKLRARINGLVVDTTGIGLPGVSVSVKNNNAVGTSTDMNGRYVLEVEENAVLVFSMVGFITQELSVKNKTVLDVVMKVSTNNLEDIVVVGFGRQKRSDLVGSVVSITPKDLKVPSSNLTTALAGRVAGMIAYQRSGEPGQDNADFFIRGVTTFGYKVDPLILIDNVEVTKTDLARLQVDDIASFSIMKDATSTAIYGARGANGVILITTKEGTEGKAQLSFRIENSLSSPTRTVELADPITYMKLHNESMLTRNPLGGAFYTREKIDRTIEGDDPLNFPVTDWKKSLVKEYTMNQRANLSVSGGGKLARYFVSGAFSKDNGILNVDQRNNFNSNIDLKTYTLRSNVNMNLTNTTEFLVRLNGSFDDYSGPIDGGSKVYRDIMRTNPVLFAPSYEPGAHQSYIKHILFGNSGNGDYLNPYANLMMGYKDYSRSMMLAQIELRQKLSFITEGLTFRTMANTTRNSFFDVNRKYNPFFYEAMGVNLTTGQPNLVLLNETGGTEYLDYSEGQKTISSVFYMESALNYARVFGEKHSLSGLLVHILSQRLNANVGDLQQSLPYRNTGISGRLTYAYDNRYHAEFNFGYNGSERFAEEKRFGFFPSVGLAWSVSNEKFFAPLKPVVSNLRLRGTYGIVGNDAIGSAADRFFYLSNVNMSDASRGAGFGTERGYTRNGISIDRYSNPDITWETAAKKNLGLEIGLFDKVQIMADFFSEERKNILMTRSYISATMGLNAPVRANVGEATGQGIDASIDYSGNLGRGVWFQARGNFTYATSKVKVFEEPLYKEKYLSTIGYSLSQQWGYIADRLFVDDEEVLNSPKQNFGEYMGGDIKYRDVNNDGQITGLDRVPLGFPTNPEIVYGFGFSAGKGNFDISAFLQGLSRESFWIDAAATSPFGSYRYSGETANKIVQTQLLKAYADNHWSEENRNLYALWPRLSSTRVENNEVRSTYFMQNGAFLRLKQVEFGYSLSKNLNKRLHTNKVRIYFNATNLFTWSSFKLWDVEMAGNGLDYPIQRVFNLGLQASF